MAYDDDNRVPAADQEGDASRPREIVLTDPHYFRRPSLSPSSPLPSNPHVHHLVTTTTTVAAANAGEEMNGGDDRGGGDDLYHQRNQRTYALQFNPSFSSNSTMSSTAAVVSPTPAPVVVFDDEEKRELRRNNNVDDVNDPSKLYVDVASPTTASPAPTSSPSKRAKKTLRKAFKVWWHSPSSAAGEEESPSSSSRDRDNDKKATIVATTSSSETEDSTNEGDDRSPSSRNKNGAGRFVSNRYCQMGDDPLDSSLCLSNGGTRCTATKLTEHDGDIDSSSSSSSPLPEKKIESSRPQRQRLNRSRKVSGRRIPSSLNVITTPRAANNVGVSSGRDWKSSRQLQSGTPTSLSSSPVPQNNNNDNKNHHCRWKSSRDLLASECCPSTPTKGTSTPKQSSERPKLSSKLLLADGEQRWQSCKDLRRRTDGKKGDSSPSVPVSPSTAAAAGATAKYQHQQQSAVSSRRPRLSSRERASSCKNLTTTTTPSSPFASSDKDIVVVNDSNGSPFSLPIKEMSPRKKSSLLSPSHRSASCRMFLSTLDEDEEDNDQSAVDKVHPAFSKRIDLRNPNRKGRSPTSSSPSSKTTPTSSTPNKQRSTTTKSSLHRNGRQRRLHSSSRALLSSPSTDNANSNRKKGKMSSTKSSKSSSHSSSQSPPPPAVNTNGNPGQQQKRVVGGTVSSAMQFAGISTDQLGTFMYTNNDRTSMFRTLRPTDFFRIVSPC